MQKGWDIQIHLFTKQLYMIDLTTSARNIDLEKII
jgi:hypothetical protein